MKEGAKFLLVGILVLFGIILLCEGFFVVEPGYNGFTVTLGKVNPTVYTD